MRLAEIDKRNFDVMLLQTNSTKMEIFLRDRVRRKFHANTDAVIDVSKTSQLSEVHQLLGVIPPFSERWVVFVDCSKVDLKRLKITITESTTCVFVLSCDKYKNFKGIQDELSAVHSLQVMSFYLTYLRRDDIIYLYDAFVPSSKRLHKVLFDYIVQGYSGDIDALFDIFQAVGAAEDGTEWSRSKISDIGGIGGMTIEAYLFTLLKPLSGSDKGLKRVMKSRIEAGEGLANVYGWGTLYSYMRSALLGLIDLKMLIMSGKVYRVVRDVPDGYDSKRISRYQKYIWRLNSTPMSTLLQLAGSMGKQRWHDANDFLGFYYKWVAVQSKEVLRFAVY